MKKSTIRLTAASAAIGLLLTGCSSADGGGENSGANGSEAADNGATHESGEPDHGGTDHEDMDHESDDDSGGHGSHSEDGGDPPEGIEKAADPKFDVGDTVALSADHMPGMKGAKATIDSSTDETVYMVDIETDEMEMTNHKLVTESEMKAAN